MTKSVLLLFGLMLPMMQDPPSCGGSGMVPPPTMFGICPANDNGSSDYTCKTTWTGKGRTTPFTQNLRVQSAKSPADAEFQTRARIAMMGGTVQAISCTPGGGPPPLHKPPPGSRPEADDICLEPAVCTLNVTVNACTQCIKDHCCSEGEAAMCITGCVGLGEPLSVCEMGNGADIPGCLMTPEVQTLEACINVNCIGKGCVQ